MFSCSARVETGGLGQVEQRETRRFAGSPPGSLSQLFLNLHLVILRLEICENHVSALCPAY